jgi:NADH:ubiquinone oxidoreductase subunit E
MPTINSPAELDRARQAILSKRDPDQPRVSVCAGAGCLATGAEKVIAALNAELEKQGLKDKVHVKGTGCPGFCERGPVMVIDPEETCYLQVTPKDVPEIVS